MNEFMMPCCLQGPQLPLATGACLKILENLNADPSLCLLGGRKILATGLQPAAAVS